MNKQIIYFLFIILFSNRLHAQNTVNVLKQNGDIVAEKIIVLNYGKKNIKPRPLITSCNCNNSTQYSINTAKDSTKIYLCFKNFGQETAIKFKNKGFLLSEINGTFAMPDTDAPSAFPDEYLLPPNEGFSNTYTANIKTFIGLQNLNLYYYYSINYWDLNLKKKYYLHKVYKIISSDKNSDLYEATSDKFLLIKNFLIKKGHW